MSSAVVRRRRRPLIERCALCLGTASSSASASASSAALLSSACGFAGLWLRQCVASHACDLFAGCRCRDGSIKLGRAAIAGEVAVSRWPRKSAGRATRRAKPSAKTPLETTPGGRRNGACGTCARALWLQPPARWCVRRCARQPRRARRHARGRGAAAAAAPRCRTNLCARRMYALDERRRALEVCVWCCAPRVALGSGAL